LRILSSSSTNSSRSLSAKPLEAERLKRRTLHDSPRRSRARLHDRYRIIRVTSTAARPARPPTLLDYFNVYDTNFFDHYFDESHVTVPRVGGMYAGDRLRRKDLILNTAFVSRQHATSAAHF
jgi:excinuclease ABC subunit B